MRTTCSWVNSLFQDAQPLAKGIFEGISAQAVGDVKALRMARLELDDAYVPEQHDAALRLLSSDKFTKEELALLPATVITVGGDSATYDIEFGAFSRLLASNTPIKVVVLNTGAYSNTGGQASTSSFIGQDADLSRHGAAHSGKYEARKELGPDQLRSTPTCSCVRPAPRCKTTSSRTPWNSYSPTDSPAVLDVYTPCQGENGIADNISARQAQLAVKSRMTRCSCMTHAWQDTAWFSLEGNPDPDQALEQADDRVPRR